MKSQYIKTAVLVALLMSLGQAYADGKKLSKDQVPKAVIGVFEKAYPNAKKLKFEEEILEGKAVYEVEYKDNDKEYEILYSPDGIFLQKGEEIDVKSLPDPVVQAILKAHPKAKIKEAEKLMKADETVIGYEVEIKVAGKEIELDLDVNGNILKTEKD